MIYTITFNPALDYTVRVDDFKLGNVNRTSREEVYAGGKGINVSIVLKNLGVESRTLGYIAGFTGDEIEKKVKSYGCITDFIKLEKGMSRINIKLKSNEESEINGQGPEITEKDLLKLYDKLQDINKGDILVLGGSIPSNLPENIYEVILEQLEGRDIKFIVDATGDLLLNVLKYKPFLIKPNHREIEEVFNVEIKNEEELVDYGFKLRSLGAKNVLISRASKGAIFIGEDNNVVKLSAPKGKLVNSVGAGDSMVAGFISGYLKDENLIDALKVGIATGSASAFSEGLASREKVKGLLETIK